MAENNDYNYIHYYRRMVEAVAKLNNSDTSDDRLAVINDIVGVMPEYLSNMFQHTDKLRQMPIAHNITRSEAAKAARSVISSHELFKFLKDDKITVDELQETVLNLIAVIDPSEFHSVLKEDLSEGLDLQTREQFDALLKDVAAAAESSDAAHPTAKFSVQRTPMFMDGAKVMTDVICSDGSVASEQKLYDMQYVQKVTNHEKLQAMFLRRREATEAKCTEGKSQHPTGQTPAPELEMAQAMRVKATKRYDEQTQSYIGQETFNVKGLCNGSAEPFSGSVTAPENLSASDLLGTIVAPQFCAAPKPEANGQTPQ